MKQTSIFRRGMSTLVALVLFVGFTYSQTLNINSTNFTNNGTIRVGGNINNGSAGGPVNAGIIELKGTGTQEVGTDAGPRLVFSRLLINATGDGTKNLNVNIEVTDSLRIHSSAGASSNFTIEGTEDSLILGDAIVNSEGSATTPFTLSTGFVRYGRSGTQTIFATTYSDLSVSGSGTKSLGGNVTATDNLNVVAGDLTIGANTLTAGGAVSLTGTLTSGSASSVLTLNSAGGGGAFTLALTDDALGTLNLNRNNTVTLGDNLTVGNSLDLVLGTLAVSTNTLTLSNTVSQTTGTMTSATTGTVIYNDGDAGQNVLAASYGNLTFSAATKSLASDTIFIAGTFTSPTASGHTVTGNTINFNGGDQTIPAFSFNNLYATGTANSKKTASGDITIAGRLDVGGGTDIVDTLDMGSNLLTLGSETDNTNSVVQFGGASNGIAINSGTVQYNGTNQDIGDGSYATLLLSNSGTKTVLTAETVTTTSSVTVSSGVGLTLAAASSTLNVGGSLTVDGTLTNNGLIDIGN